MSECPSGYQFGIDSDKRDECDACDIWIECCQALHNQRRKEKKMTTDQTPVPRKRPMEDAQAAEQMDAKVQLATVADLEAEVERELIEEMSLVQRNKLKKMILEIKGLERLLAQRKQQLEEFKAQPLQLGPAADAVFELGAL